MRQETTQRYFALCDVHQQRRQGMCALDFQIPPDFVVNNNPLILFSYVFTDLATEHHLYTLSNRNGGVRRSHHRRSMGLPRNRVECGFASRRRQACGVVATTHFVQLATHKAVDASCGLTVSGRAPVRWETGSSPVQRGTGCADIVKAVTQS